MTTTAQPRVAAIYGQVDLDKIKPMDGFELQDRMEEAKIMLALSHNSIYLIGPSGAGKTHFGYLIGKHFSRKWNVPFYYTQMSPDLSKTSLIAGMRMTTNGFEPVIAMIGKAMLEGGIVFIDEATHTFTQMLLNFNSMTERNTITSIGELTIQAHPHFRMFFASNDDSHVGNIRLPQSFGMRLHAFPFDYPSFQTEWKVAYRIAMEEHEEAQNNGDINFPFEVPRSMAKYLTGYVRDVRSMEYPLSARNIANALLRLSACKHLLTTPFDPMRIDTHFQKSQPLVENIYAYLYQQKHTSDHDLTTSDILEVIALISNIGVEVFRQKVLASVGYYLPIDGIEIGRKAKLQDLQAKLP